MYAVFGLNINIKETKFCIFLIIAAFLLQSVKNDMHLYLKRVMLLLSAV